jgi:ribosomal-protein-alanine N-acetyltransferase
MQKAGMTYEGTLRQKAFTKGRFWDVKSYSVLKSDGIPD